MNSFFNYCVVQQFNLITCKIYYLLDDTKTKIYCYVLKFKMSIIVSCFSIHSLILLYE